MVRLPVLSSDDLAHFDDSRLDDLYEEKLSLTGDDLRLIDNAAELVAPLIPAPATRQTAGMANGNGSAAAVVPAFDVEALRNEISPEINEVEIPELGDDPTDEQLLEYARAHIGVRTAMRVFRAKIVEVKRVQ
jgi:hypothetical protein